MEWQFNQKKSFLSSNSNYALTFLYFVLSYQLALQSLSLSLSVWNSEKKIKLSTEKI